MAATDTAKLAIDANFDINGVAAKYHSTWPSDGVDCTVMPDQADATFGLEVVKVTQASANFAVRKSEISPAKGCWLVVEDIRYRVEEAPTLDAFRLVYQVRCVKA